jgi:rhodanese-related sulfurtransferase
MNGLDIDPKEPFYLHCAGGYRSMIASILQARGFRNFSEIEGGFNAITKLQYQPPILSAKVKHFNLSLLY